MQRLNPEDAARLQGMDMEAEKASARLNMILNVAAFIVIVGVIRVGKFTMTCHGYTVMDLNLRVLAAITELVKRNKYNCVLISSVQGRLLGDISPALCRHLSETSTQCLSLSSCMYRTINYICLYHGTFVTCKRATVHLS